MTKVCNLVRDVVASTQKYLQSHLSRGGQYTDIALYKLPKITEEKQIENILRKQTKTYPK